MRYSADKKETLLYWFDGKQGKTAYFRKKINGRDHWQSLGLLAPDDARGVVRKLKQAHALGLLNEKLGFISKRSDVSSFEDLFRAYDKFCAGIVIEPRTVENNKGCVSLILRRVHGEGFNVDKALVSVFDVQLLRDFAARSVALRKGVCEKLVAEGKLSEEGRRKKLEAVQRTIKSTVQQARSLFSKEALASRAYEELVLPDMGAVMALSVGASSVVPYEAPAQAVLDRIAADVGALKVESPGMWLAFNLEVNGALRRGSAIHARWDWFTVISDCGLRSADLAPHGGAVAGAGGADNPKSKIQNPKCVDLRVGVAKGGESVLRFDSALYEEMVALKGKGGGEEYILPGESVEERDEVCAGLVAWLRARGLDKRQPNHELRKLYGDRKYSEHGAEEAQRALGHSDSKLTSKVYASARARRALRVM